MRSNFIDPYGRDKTRGTKKAFMRQANADAERMRRERERKAKDQQGEAVTRDDGNERQS